MNIISEADFLKKKTSTTIFVLGSGPSINDVSSMQWDIIKRHNSIALNWFCKHEFEPTFYLIREQSNLPQRKSKGETIRDFVGELSKYKNTTCIISDVSNHTKKAYQYKKDNRITLDCFVVRDNKNTSHASKMKKYMRHSPLEIGLIHGSCTLYNIMHLILFLKYEQIVFVGVDLYNSRYFWLPRNQTRHTVVKKGQNYLSKHSITEDVLRLVSRFKHFGIPMFASNNKSLLNKVIPYKNISDFLDITK